MYIINAFKADSKPLYNVTQHGYDYTKGCVTSGVIRRSGVIMTFTSWWGDWRLFEPEKYLSMLELVKSGSLDLRLASLLWVLMEKRVSIMVVAGPSWAGKTTVLNALLDFLPPETRQVKLQGNFGAIEQLQKDGPSGIYMVADEISNHLFGYVWGEVARRVFDMLPRGYPLGGAMHARNAREALEVLHYYLDIPLSVLAHIRVIIVLRAMPGRSYTEEPIRYMEAVSLVRPLNDGISLQVIAARGPDSDHAEFTGEKELKEALSRVIGKCESVIEEMSRRERFLGRMMEECKLSREEVREAVAEYYIRRAGEKT